MKKLQTRDIVIIILIVLVVLLSLCSALFYHKYRDANAQIVIWNDSTYVYKNKYNEEYLAKNTYILKASELEQYNKELLSEYKKLKDNPLVIVKTDVITKIDTVETIIQSIVQDSDKISWKWEANDSAYYAISGEAGILKNDTAVVPYTKINEATIDARLTMDVVDNGKQLAVIAKTDNPYVQLSNMQSVIIDPLNSPTIKNLNKPKRWGFGPTISAGIYTGYDFTTGKICVGAGGMVGFSIHYDIFQW